MAGITFLLAVVCAVLIFHVNVNSDMTKYLPDSSQMKKGMAVMEEEFAGAANTATGADVKAMFKGLNEEEALAVADSLAAIPEVEGVDYSRDASGEYVLYELNVPKSVDQKTLGAEIRKDFDGDVVVETSQDGATPPASVMIIAAAMILLILVLMAQSWLDPFIFILTTGIAVVLNIGTNALLPSVSITTNYIVAILQMVLSLDYSIVLMNRYRQEKNPMRTSVMAVNVAVKRAVPSILSSALTTVVGLLMLVFMRLKIGMDMGIVLAKGVVCSLFCTFTLLPTLLILFHKGVMNTGKKTFVLPTDRLSRFATKYKVPLSIFALALFVTSFYFSKKTDISFSSNGESEIEKIFPKVNPVVLVYDTSDEMAVIPLADSLRTIPGVKSVISYPTILKQEYTAEQMCSQLTAMSEQFSDYIPQDADLSILTPELMRIVYYMKFQDNPERKIGFPALAEFILKNCADNPMFAAYMDDSMKEKLALMQSMTDFGAAEEEEEVVETVVESQETAKSEKDTSKPAVTESKAAETKEDAPIKVVSTAPAGNSGNISVINFMPKLYAYQPTFETGVLKDIVDTVTIRKKMAAPEMSAFIGSTAGQTKMVYSFSKSSSKTMTPIEYVHFLSDDLFNRKALSSMVSADQKKGLRMRMKVMDYADADVKLSAADMAALVTDFGVSGITEDVVRSIVNPKPVETTKPVVDTPSVQPAETLSVVTAPVDTTAVADSNAVVVTPAPAPVKPKKSLAEQRQDLFMYLMSTDKEFTAAQMSRYFKRLGENMDPAIVSLLYTYYGSVKDYDDSNKMCIEDLLNYASDNIATDERIRQFIPDGALSSLSGVREQLAETIGMMRNDSHSILAIITDLPTESAETYAFIDRMNEESTELLSQEYYTVGESVMYSEMKKGFGREITIVTILTVLAIFLIVAISFKSLVVPTILVMTVMTAVYVNVVFSGVFSGTMLYLAYLIVQSILMGATIDYGILFTNYYKEKRKIMPISDAVREAYRGSIRTIMTSGLIMVAAPGAMAAMVDDVAISAIVGSLAIGALVAVVLILVVVPGLLAAFDRWVVHGRVYGRNRKENSK